MFKFQRAITLGKINEDWLLLSFKLIQHVQLALTTACKSGKNAWHSSLNASRFKKHIRVTFSPEWTEQLSYKSL